MIRNIALGALFLALLILGIILREEHLISRGKVPLGRLRRLWVKRERRRCPRYRVDFPIRYQRPPAEWVHQATTWDLSSTGVGLILLERLEPGTTLSMEVTLPKRPTPVSLLGRVVWIREVPARSKNLSNSRLFFAGIQFYSMDLQLEAALNATLRSGEKKT